MKTLMTLVVISMFALPAFADDTAAPAPATPSATATAPAKGKGNACKPIMEACKAANFKGKDMFKKCVKPLKEGKTVEGVTVDPADLQACKEMKGNWKGKHKHHKDDKDDQGGAAATQ